MKKITNLLLIAFLMFSGYLFSQVNINETFATTTAPSGWALGSGSLTTTQSCATAAWRKNVYSTTTGTTLSTPTWTSNGQDVQISFKYKIVNWSAATAATDPYNGTLTTEVSVDGGTTWTVTAGQVNNSNHVVANTCATVSYVVPGASVPNGNSIRVRFNAVWGTSGDYYVYIDDVTVQQVSVTPPNCTAGFAPADMATDVAKNATLSWNAEASATSYDVYFGTTTPAPFVGNQTALSYTPALMTDNTMYYWKVVPKNINGDAVGCSEMSFTTGTGFVYCSSGLTTSGGASDTVAEVTIGSYSSGNVGGVAPWYIDVNNTPISLAQGTIVPVAITMGTDGTQHSAIWIDFNQNGVFEASENVALSTTSAGSSAVVNYNINIPLSATLGVTKMRIRGAGDTAYTAAGACTGQAWGETEDYNVEIVTPPSCLAPTALSAGTITVNSAELSWTASTSMPSSNYDIYWSTSNTAPDGTTTPSVTNQTSPYTASGLSSSTTYYWWVRANCGGGDTSSWASGGSFTTVLSCGDNFYDSGGAGSDYSTDENITTVVYPTAGNVVTVTFSSFDTEEDYDYLKVYDGPDDTYPALHSGDGFSGTTIPGPFTSTDASGALTFVFTSDFSVVGSGWEAVVSCAASPCSVTHTWDGTAWSPSAPVANQKAVIAGNYTGAGFEACSLDVTSGTVVFDSGTLVIDGVITVDAAASVTLENDINLVQNQDVANVGNITVKRNSEPMLWLDYTYWSSPVSDQNLMAFSPNTLWQRFYSYNESAGAWANADPVNSSFAEGIGYSIRADNTQQATPTVAVVHNGEFTGVPFNGDVSVPVTVGSGGGFNLLGNPYASTIDADTFLTDNAATGISTLYFWTHQNQSNQATGGTYDQNNYASYTLAGGAGTTTADNSSVVPNGEIQIGQGFFVEATTAGNAVFNNAQRMNTNSGQFFKTTNTVERNRIWLNFGNGSLDHNQMMVAYMTGATLGVDTAIDGKLLSTASSNLYSLIDNTTAEYVIQGRSLPFDDNDEVALGFVAATAGNYTIALDHVDGLFNDQAIYLWDKQLNVIHDIKTSAYTFTSAEGQFDARFSLVYKNNLKAETAVVTADAIVYVENHQIMISTGNQLLKSVTVYDIQGRKLFSQANINTSEFAVEKVNATNQVVLVEIETENGKTTKKVKL
ncbi:GEVED domain-containing protein [Flavobacterium sp.]|uniref:GEVED domain-containing protein n=1 Tax=Flavobacterium sp. TaxID=239 RepID=UPI003526FF12